MNGSDTNRMPVYGMLTFRKIHRVGAISQILSIRTPSICVLLAIILSGTALRLFGLDAKSLWMDEGFSVWVAQMPLVGLLQIVLRLDHHPPLYYVILAGWMLLAGKSVVAIRLLSALFGILTIPLTYQIARLLAGKPIAVLAAAWIAFAPLHVRYGQEARMYALLTLAATVAIYAVMRLCLVLDDSDRKRTNLTVILAVAQAAAMLGHNTAVLLLPLVLNAGVLLLFVRRVSGCSRPAFLRLWIGGQLLAFLLWLPWLGGFLHQVAVVRERFWIPAPTLTSVWQTYHDMNVPLLSGAFSWFPVVDVFSWAAAALGLWSLRKEPGRVRILATLFAIPPLVELLISLRRPIFFTHTLLWTTIPYAVLVAAGCVTMIRWLSSRLVGQTLLAACSILLAIWYDIALWDYHAATRKEEWREAAAYVESACEPGDLVLFHGASGEMLFTYYLQDSHCSLEFRGIPAALDALDELEPTIRREDLPALRRLIAERSRVWLVYSHDWYSDPDALIPQTLDAVMSRFDTRQFYGIQIMLYRRTS